MLAVGEMRSLTDAEKVRRFMETLGHRSTGPGRVYLTGGATAVLFGWRAMTVDIDIKLDPEPPGAFEAIVGLKEELDVNVELAAPDQFIPALDGWRERSLFIGTIGPVDFFHYDPAGQALAKIERGHTRDLADVREMIARGLVRRDELSRFFEDLRPDLVRYPALDPAAFEAKVRAFVDAGGGA